MNRQVSVQLPVLAPQVLGYDTAQDDTGTRMNRRDFLRLKTERGIRTVELSCQQLYVHSLESRVTNSQLEEDFDPAEEGEPPAAFNKPTTEQLFENLRADLDGADILRVVGHRWLSEGDEELRQGFSELLSSFRARGGRVEFG